MAGLGESVHSDENAGVIIRWGQICYKINLMYDHGRLGNGSRTTFHAVKLWGISDSHKLNSILGHSRPPIPLTEEREGLLSAWVYRTWRGMP